jgi:hypothetical protein
MKREIAFRYVLVLSGNFNLIIKLARFNSILHKRFGGLNLVGDG